jgi:hypothetical protein
MQARRLKTVLLAFALACFCVACHVTNERFIAGTYRAESPCSDITLVVNRDRSFTQSVHTRTGGASQISGRWTIDEKGWITFKPFLDFLNDDQGRQLEAALFRPEILPRGITMGPVVIKCPDSDHQIDYIK